MWHTYTPQPLLQKSINFLYLMLSEIQSRQDYKGPSYCIKVKGQIKVTPWRYTPTLPQPRSPPSVNCLHQWLQDIACTRFLKIKVTTTRSHLKSRLHHDTARLHPQPMFLPSINFLHLTVSKYTAQTRFQKQGHYIKVKDQMKVTS